MTTGQSIALQSGSARLSVTIVAQNEERTIAEVLSAVKDIAHEIILVDSGSTDRTREIAAEFGVRLYQQSWLGYAAQKNLALDLAHGDWILSLDADEVLTPALATEIQQILNGGGPPNTAGFKIPRVLYIGNVPVRGGGFYPDAQLRLIRRGKGRFQPRVVHESIRVDGKVAQLKHDMLHYAYRDVAEFSETMDRYARLSARHYFENDHSAWRASLVNEIVRPLWTLFYRQVVRGGVFQGPLCWRLNLIYAGYVRNKTRYLRQLVNERKS